MKNNVLMRSINTLYFKMNKRSTEKLFKAQIYQKSEANVLCSSNDKIISSFEIYHPKNNIHNPQSF
jgi:hypothetical protein